MYIYIYIYIYIYVYIYIYIFVYIFLCIVTRTYVPVNYRKRLNRENNDCVDLLYSDASSTSSGYYKALVKKQLN